MAVSQLKGLGGVANDFSRVDSINCGEIKPNSG